MSESLRTLIANLSPDGRASLRALLRARSEPLAIIGIGCRFPGKATDPDSFWELLVSGTDAIREVPPDRWDLGSYFDPDPRAPGKMYTKWGGFLEEVDKFDAEFFNISPREAARMDPQQRLFLEVVLEALQDAGQTDDQLAGGRVGVFVGACASDYCHSLFTDPTTLDAYVATGNAHSIIANRVSYLLDLKGPSLAVDTACSSSLVTVHLACQSLIAGECDMALAGGVQILLSPFATITFSKALMMAPDGRCKTFDAAADGFVRGEGAGVVALKRLDDALRARDPIHAVIFGTAINQDGRSNGLMAPSGWSQQAVIREALERAGIDGGEVSYVETHGTGTALGDPIEVESLAAVLGAQEPGTTQCALGAVKTNLGHLEGAAGIAGLIKAVLALEHETIPQNLHFKRLNPHISLRDTRLKIPESAIPWPKGEAPRYGSVSSFGFGGTNAHVVVGDAPVAQETITTAPACVNEPKRAELVAISGRNPAALAQAARDLRAFLRTAGFNRHSLRDIAYTLDVRRTHYEYRAVMVAESCEELSDRLSALLRKRRQPDLVEAVAQRTQRKEVVFVFSGQGGQWAGMGRELSSEPAYRDALEECDAEFSRDGGISVIDELGRDETDSLLRDTVVAQPVIFSVQVALAALWRAWGIVPAAVVGHSLGEVAAAHLAGALSLKDAVHVIRQRSRVMGSGAAKGSMMSVELPATAAASAIGNDGARVAIGVVNGPSSVVLSGEPAVIEALKVRLTAEGIVCRPLSVSYAFHSPHMEEHRQALIASLEGLSPCPEQVPFYSCVLGGRWQGTPLDEAYWARNVCEPVLFLSAMQALLADEYSVFLELGSPDLTLHMTAILAEQKREGMILTSLRRNKDERRAMLRAGAALHAHGCGLDLRILYPTGDCVRLPHYPWQRKRHWVQECPRDRFAAALTSSCTSEPCLPGRRIPSPLREVLFEGRLSAEMPVVAGRSLAGKAVVSAAVFLDAAMTAARKVVESGTMILESAVPERPCVVPRKTSLQLQSVVTPASTGNATVHLYSREAADVGGDWRPHFSVRACRGEIQAQDEVNLPEIQRHCTSEIAPATFYDLLGKQGLLYGELYRVLARLWKGCDEALSSLCLQDSANSDSHSRRVSILEGCIQTLSAALPHQEAGLYLVSGVKRFSMREVDAAAQWCHARVRSTVSESNGVSAVGDVQILDAAGHPVGELVGLELRLCGAEELERLRAFRAADWLYEMCWREDTSAPLEVAERSVWLLLTEPGALADEIRAQIEATGDTCVTASVGKTPDRQDPKQCLLDSLAPEKIDALIETVFSKWAPARWNVVHLLSVSHVLDLESDNRVLRNSVEQLLGSALSLVQALARRPGKEVRFYLVTRGAQAVLREDPVDPVQAPLWGFGTVVSLEHAELWGGAIDLAKESIAGEAKWLVEEITRSSREDRVAYRRGGRWVPRLELSPMQACPPAPYRPSPEGTYLVTGGLGGLGLEVTRALIAAGARHLLLIARSNPTPEADARLNEFRACGAEVVFRQVDVADDARLTEVLSEVETHLPPLRGVVHAAGVLDDGIVMQQCWERFANVLSPKIHGSWALHRVTRARVLDFFVLFSSAAAVLGSPGQSNYAAANAFLGALTHMRRALGLPSTTVEWGPWRDVGMTARTMRSRMLEEVGSIPLSQGMEILRRLAVEGPPQTVVLPTDWSALGERLPAGRRPTILASLLDSTAAPVETAPAELLNRLRNTPAVERSSVIARYLREQIIDVLGLDPAYPLELTRGFFDMGMDSLMALDLKGRLDVALGRTTSPVVIFEHPNIASLAEFLAAETLASVTQAPDETLSSIPANAKPEGKTLAKGPRVATAEASLLDVISQVSDTDAEEMLRELAS